MENNSSPTNESDLSDFQNNDNYQAQETDHFSDWDVPVNNENYSADVREAVTLQASEVVGEVLSDLETKESELIFSKDKPVETKVKFVMTKVMEAGTSRNETRVAKKHKGKRNKK